MSSLAKFSQRIDKKNLTNLFVFASLFFSLSRLVRETDLLYVFAVLSFLVIWVLNIRSIFNLEFKRSFVWFLLFGIWATLSSIWSLESFISFTRGLSYIFISSTAVLIGFLYKSKVSDLLKIFLVLNALIIFVSIVSLVSGLPSDAWTANHGMGFTSIFTHQNSFAAVLMFTLIGPIYFLIEKGFSIPNLFQDPQRQMLNQVQHDNKSSSHFEFISESKEETKKKENVISNLFRVRNLIVSRSLIILNLYFIYLSYSRAVMLALFIGGIVMSFLLNSKKNNIIFVLVGISIAISLFYFWGGGIQSYLKKGGSDYSGRRNILWEPSYKSAVNGGFIGLGYGVTDPTVESNYKKENRLGELKREKGNSILALVEETGIVGLTLFLLPLIFSFKNYLFRNSFSCNVSTSLLFSFLTVFIVHTQFEGWMVGVSSFYLVVFLTITSIFVFNSNKLTKMKNLKT